MNRPFRGTPLAYVLAIVLVLLAGLIRWSLAPVDAGFPFITFIGACTLAALLGGLGAGFLALVLSLLAAKYFFILHHHNTIVTSSSHAHGTRRTLAQEEDLLRNK